jgi:hypothetical protein
MDLDHEIIDCIRLTTVDSRSIGLLAAAAAAAALLHSSTGANVRQVGEECDEDCSGAVLAAAAIVNKCNGPWRLQLPHLVCS